MDSPKYPRTFHLPWSKGVGSDDKVQHDLSTLLDCDLILTQKMDGSNVCLEREACYARTHSSAPTHASFDAFKQLHATVKYNLPKGLQIFGEWLYALHSIPYFNLPNYLMIFGVRDLQNGEWASWDEVVMWADELGIPTVPVLEQAIFSSQKELERRICYWMVQPSIYSDLVEGVVTRKRGVYSSEDFSKSVVKYVRANHVTTSTHWKDQEIIRNGLAG